MPRLSVFFLRAALLHLGVGITFGALMLANKGVPFLPWLWRLLDSHVELVFIGWTVQLALGVAQWILPRLPGPQKYGRESFGWAAFALLNAGVLVVALGALLGSSALALAGRLCEFVAVVFFVYQVWPRVRALAPTVTQDHTESVSL